MIALTLNKLWQRFYIDFSPRGLLRPQKYDLVMTHVAVFVLDFGGYLEIFAVNPLAKIVASFESQVETNEMNSNGFFWRILFYSN